MDAIRIGDRIIEPLAIADAVGRVFDCGHDHGRPKCFADAGYWDEIKRTLEELETRSTRQLRDVLLQARDALISRVKRVKDLPTPREVNLKGLTSFRYGIRDMLEAASSRGRVDARREVRLAKAKLRQYDFNPDQPSDEQGQWTTGPGPGERFTVYRLGTEKQLHNRNAGNADAIARHIMGVEDGFSPIDSKAQHIHAFHVSIDHPWGDYAGFKNERTLGNSATAGRAVRGSEVTYSFPKGAGFTAKHVGSVSLTEARAVLKRMGHGSFDDAGSTAGARAIRRAMGHPTTKVKKLEEEARAFDASAFKPRAAATWMREKEFYVTDLLDQAITKDVKTILVNALKTGMLNGEVADKIWTAFEAYVGDPDVLRDGVPLSPARLETIVRTNLTDAYNHGRMMEYTSDEMLPFLNGIRYSAILDNRTTECCAYLDGKVFTPEDPDLTDLLPPNHFNCRSVVVPVVVGEEINEDEFITPAEVGKARSLADTKFLAFDPDQPRDSQGQWTDGNPQAGSGFPKDDEQKARAAAGKSYHDTDGFLRSGGLNPTERDAEQAFYDRLRTEPDQMVAEYHAMFGNTIDPDQVKQLSPDFRADKSLAAAVHEPSSAASKIIYARALAENKGTGQPVVFTAGGGGSGKTEAMGIAQKVAGTSAGGVVFDSTLSSPRSAIAKIDQALHAGAPVEILYTNRPVDDAFRFAAGRARVVPLEVLAHAHVGASDTIRELSEHYASNPQVRITVVNNTGSLADMKIGAVSDVPKYNLHEVTTRLQSTAAELHKAGAISDAKYAALTKKT